jgi:NTE family protein
MMRIKAFTALLCSFVIIFNAFSVENTVEKLSDIESDYSSVLRERPIRVAIALGACGSRAMAHLGFLEEIEKAGIPIDMILGTSSGSFVGALYCDRPDAAYVASVMRSLDQDAFLSVDWTDALMGLSDVDPLGNVLKRHLSCDRFERLSIPFVVIAGDLKTGELVKFDSGPIVPPVMASCAYPFYYKPVEYQGRTLIDGGLVNPIPGKIAKEYGAELVIGVDLSCPLTPELPSSLIGVVTRCLDIMYRRQLETCVKDLDIYVKIPVEGMSTFDSGQKEKLYQMGREAAWKALPQIRAALDQMPEYYN